MLERQPYLPRFMAGGPGNPLGARAMYLGGTVYRIHGTNAPETIGSRVSSGCIRLVNEDVIDLYGRVNVGTKVDRAADRAPRRHAGERAVTSRRHSEPSSSWPGLSRPSTSLGVGSEQVVRCRKPAAQ